MKEIIAIENDGFEPKLIVMDTESQKMSTVRLPINL